MSRLIPIALTLLAPLFPTAAGASTPVCHPVPGVNDACPAWTSTFDTPEHRRWLGADAEQSALSHDGETLFVTGTAPTADGAQALAVIALGADDGARRWSFMDAGLQEARGLGIAASSDTVFVAGVTGIDDDAVTEGLLLAIDAASGRVRWRERVSGAYQLDEMVEVALSADGSTVYAAGHTMDDYTYRDVTVIAFDARSGQRRWSRTLGKGEYTEELVSSLVVTPQGELVVAVTEDFYGRGLFVLHRFDADGEARTQIREDAPVWTRGLLNAFELSSDGSLGVAVGARLWGDGRTAGQRVVAFSMTKGEQMWDAWVGEVGQAMEVAIAPNGDRIFVSGYEPGMTVIPPGTVSLGNGLDQRVTAFAAGTGTKLWQHRFATPGYGDDVVIDLAVEPDGSRVVAAGFASTIPIPFAGVDPATDCASYLAGTCHRTWGATTLMLTGLEASTGTVAWRAPQRPVTADATSVRSLILNDEGTRAIVTGTTSSPVNPPPEAPSPGYVTRFEISAYDLPS